MSRSFLTSAALAAAAENKPMAKIRSVDQIRGVDAGAIMEVSNLLRFAGCNRSVIKSDAGSHAKWGSERRQRVLLTGNENLRGAAVLQLALRGRTSKTTSR